MNRLLNGKPVSRFAFGTMQFGGAADERASVDLFEASLEAGITHFDCAHLYTGGAAEEILGRLAAPHLDRISVATKIGYRGAAPEQLRAEFDLSRRRLKMDSIDLLYLHKFDPDVGLAAQIEVLQDFQSRGWVGDFGLSNFAAWQVMKARSLGLDVATVQPMYSLVKRQAEVEILPMCASEGLLCFGYSPLGSGLLTGKYQDPKAQGRLAADARYAARYDRPDIHRAAADLTKFAGDLGVHPATLAAAWAACHPTAVIPILSARSVVQLVPSLAAMSFEMTPEIYHKLSRFYPAPLPATDRLEEV